jgi:hypothetical protein
MIAIQRSTGEVLDAALYPLPLGSKCYTPEDQKAYKERKEQEHAKRLQRAANSPLGHFYFVPTVEQFKGISPASVVRLIYLNTFIKYDDHNRLMLSERTQMKREDLADVLKLSKPTICRFLKEVSPLYLNEKGDGLVFSNKNIFLRGSGRIHKRNDYNTYVKVYIKGVRELYQSTEAKNHKHLGYLFKLLPLISVEYNLLCRNPFEVELDKVECITLSEFCDLIGFGVSHLNRLLYVYNTVRFEVDGRRERFCGITHDGLNRSNAKIYINPHILYSGSDYKRVEILGAFCKD